MSFSGLLNTTCTIQVKTKTQNATSGQVEESSAEHAALVKCRLDQASGGEVRKPDNIYSRRAHRLFIEYRTDLDEHNYQIVVGGNTYNILNIIQAGGTNRHTEIDLEIIE